MPSACARRSAPVIASAVIGGRSIASDQRAARPAQVEGEELGVVGRQRRRLRAQRWSSTQAYRAGSRARRTAPGRGSPGSARGAVGELDHPLPRERPEGRLDRAAVVLADRPVERRPAVAVDLAQPVEDPATQPAAGRRERRGPLPRRGRAVRDARSPSGAPRRRAHVAQAAAAAHQGRAGHSAQRGARIRQTVAPRSMSACVQRPGSSAGTSSSAAAWSRARAERPRARPARRRCRPTTRRTLTSTAPTALAEGERRDRPGRVRTEAGQPLEVGDRPSAAGRRGRPRPRGHSAAGSGPAGRSRGRARRGARRPATRRPAPRSWGSGPSRPASTARPGRSASAGP